MSEFNNATVVKAANIYYDGQVTSRTVILEDGSKVTLGIMLPGKYEFGTEVLKSWKSSPGSLKCFCRPRSLAGH